MKKQKRVVVKNGTLRVGGVEGRWKLFVGGGEQTEVMDGMASGLDVMQVVQQALD